MFAVGKSKSDYHSILIQHLLDSHLPYLALCYSHRISRSAVREMPVSELAYMMRNYNYTQLDIYDAANTKNLRFDPNPRCLSVLFAGENLKTDDFEYCFCLVHSPEDAAFKIVSLMEEVCVKMGKSIRILNFKRNYYNLYTAVTTQYNLKCKFEEKAVTPPQKTFKYEKNPLKNDYK
jgi:hypothetical protein